MPQTRVKRRGYAEEYLLWLLVSDLLTVALGLFLSYLLRFESRLLSTYKGWDTMDYVRIWPVAVICWGLGLAQCGAYRRGKPVFNLEMLRRLATGSVLAMAMIIAVNFFVRVGEFSRFMPLIAVMVVAVLLSLERWGFGRALRALTRRQSDPVLILGSGPVALRLARIIRAEPHHNMTLAGFITTKAEEVGHRVDGLEDAYFVGHIDELSEAARASGARRLIVAHPEIPAERLADLMLECENAIVECRIVPGLLDAIVSETSVQDVGGIPLFGLRRSPLEGWNVAIKRVFDILVSSALLVMFSPLLLLMAILVKLDSKGPVIFKQKRMGLDGRTFNMYKFRSMVEGAEEKTGPVWTTKNDARRTRVGRILRHWNLDELPQLFNVLRGDMSLVGPRPERPHFVKRFREEVPGYMRRHRVKCGMTGWAQVNGLRGDSSIQERIAYDVYYVENWSLWLDAKILLLTLLALRNAY